MTLCTSDHRSKADFVLRLVTGADAEADAPAARAGSHQSSVRGLGIVIEIETPSGSPNLPGSHHPRRRGSHQDPTRYLQALEQEDYEVIPDPPSSWVSHYASYQA